MSFILDALKKSETDRQQRTAAEFSNVPSSSSDDRPSLKWLWILGVLLLVNFAVLLGILLRPDSPAQAPVTTPMAGDVANEAATDGEPSFEEQVARARERQVEREVAAATVQADAVAEAVPEAVPEATANTAITPAAPPVRTTRRVMTIDELRLSGTLEIPDLHLDIHVYSDVPEDRFVFINMVKHREHSRLDEGPVVNEITPEGVILDYRGATFLLPRE